MAPDRGLGQCLQPDPQGADRTGGGEGKEACLSSLLQVTPRWMALQRTHLRERKPLTGIYLFSSHKVLAAPEERLTCSSTCFVPVFPCMNSLPPVTALRWVLLEPYFTAQESGAGVLSHLAQVSEPARGLLTERGWCPVLLRSAASRGAAEGCVQGHTAGLRKCWNIPGCGQLLS